MTQYSPGVKKTKASPDDPGWLTVKSTSARLSCDYIEHEAAIIFTDFASKVGVLLLADALALGLALGLAPLSLSLTVPLISTWWPTCSLSFAPPLAVTFSVLAELRPAGAVPEVPTAPAPPAAPLLLPPHFRSDSV
jgi:hypothetical protein